MLVIGAGIGGLSCAWHLAERGVDVHRRRGAHRRASGASGRNGGFLIAGAAPAHQDAVRAVRARRSRSASTARRWPRAAHLRDRRRDRRARTTSRHVGCPAGHLGARRARRTRASSTTAMRADGLPAEWVDEADLPAIVRRRGASASSPARLRRCIPRAGCGPSRARSRSAACASSSAAPCPSRSTRRATAASRCARAAAPCTPSAWSWRPTARCRSSCRYYAPHRAHEAPAHGRDGAASPSASCPARSARAGATSTSSSAPTAASPWAGSPIATARRGRLLHHRRGAIARASTRTSSASCATTWASTRRHAPLGRSGGLLARRARLRRRGARRTTALFVAGGYNGTRQPQRLHGRADRARACSRPGRSADAHLYDSARPLVTA